MVANSPRIKPKTAKKKLVPFQTPSPRSLGERRTISSLAQVALVEIQGEPGALAAMVALAETLEGKGAQEKVRAEIQEEPHCNEAALLQQHFLTLKMRWKRFPQKCRTTQL